MTFLAANRLWLLLLVAALVALYVVVQRRRRHFAVRFTNLDVLASVAPRYPGWRRHLAALLLLGSLGAMVVGFAGPTRRVKVPSGAGTVVLAIDISASMDATDIAPSRLAAAEKAATEFATQLPSRFRLGLVTFDTQARVIVPPTTDHGAVRYAIANLRLGQATAGGEAIFSALNLIKTMDSKAQTAARIVLMSDGATTTGRPIEAAAAAAADANIPISTIAFGTDAGTVTIRNQIISVPVDRDTLRAVAEATRGKFFEAASSKQLSAAYRDIRGTISYKTIRQSVQSELIAIALVLATLGTGVGLIWSSRLL